MARTRAHNIALLCVAGRGAHAAPAARSPNTALCRRTLGAVRKGRPLAVVANGVAIARRGLVDTHAAVEPGDALKAGIKVVGA